MKGKTRNMTILERKSPSSYNPEQENLKMSIMERKTLNHDNSEHDNLKKNMKRKHLNETIYEKGQSGKG